MTRTELKTQIINKFGTLQNFCELSGMGYQRVRRYLTTDVTTERGRTRRLVKEIKELIDVDNPSELSTELTLKDRSKIRALIKEKHGDLKKFTRKHPDFNYDFLVNVTLPRKNGDGSFMIKRKTQKVIELIKLLE